MPRSNDDANAKARNRAPQRTITSGVIACALLGPRVVFAQDAGVSAQATPPSAVPGASAPTVLDANAPMTQEAWAASYEDARKRLLAGEHAVAIERFDALARRAPTIHDQRLATEMAQVARSLAAREAPPPPPPPPPPKPEDPIRTRDEITILYASAFLYGAGTGTWFLLETEPDSAVTATLPFAVITAAPIVALATIDGHRPLPRGMPHAITAGLYLGLGEGIWISSYQHAHANRVDRGRARDTTWQAETIASVLWSGATLGAVAGGTLSAGLTSTPGRVSFAASTTVWLGLLSGLAATAVLPDDDHRGENAALVGGVGYNVGLVGGMLLAGPVSPSVTRVRLVDLSGATAGLVASGMYLSLAHRDADRHIGFGIAAGGAAAGLAVGTLLTSGMAREVPGPNGPRQVVTWQPMVSPVSGGAIAGIGGFM